MGVPQTCMKQRNSTHQLDLSVPTILKKKLIGSHPRRQNILMPPLTQLGEEEESLEQLELVLQEANIGCSIHKTATFQSTGGNRQQSIKQSFALNMTLTTAPTPQQLETSNVNLSFQETKKEHENNQKIIQHQWTVQKESQFKQNQEKIIDKREQFSRSLSSNSRAKKQQHNEESSHSLQQKDSETNTKKSILKNKNQQQFIKNTLSRGISLRQQQQQIDDTQSQKTQKTSKSQKKVKFDPKIFRPKNTHFFQ